MNKFLILLVVSIIPFLYFISQNNLVDSDSYYYAGQVCQGTQSVSDSSIIFPYLIQYLPCDFIVFKILLWLAFFGTILVIWKIGELFHPEGWLMALIAYGFTFLITDFWKFENDAFGYLFGFLGLYFALKCYKGLETRQSFVLACLAFGIGGLFWKGIVYWIMASSILFFPFVLVFIPLLFWQFNDFFFFLKANTGVQESTAWLGIIFLGLTVFFTFGMLKTPKKLLLAYVLLLVPALFVSKLFVLPIIFAVLVAFNGFGILMKGNLKKVESILIIWAFLMSFFWIVSLNNQFPNAGDVELTQKALVLDKNLQNSFGIGYVIEFYGGKASSKGSVGLKDWQCKGIVLLEQGLSCPNYCVKIKESQHLTLFKCPELQ